VGLVACGGAAKLPANGEWAGRLVAVDVGARQVTFEPECIRKGRVWVTARHDRISLPVSSRAGLSSYVRPNGNAAAGHSQPADLAQVASAASGPGSVGWTVTERDGLVTGLEQGSGIGHHLPAGSCVATAQRP
jgi:hypothetical protein